MNMINERRNTADLLQPQCIITDGDAAINAAIKLVWPDTYHLLCIWHIIAKNANDNLKKSIGIENGMRYSSTYSAIMFSIPFLQIFLY